MTHQRLRVNLREPDGMRGRKNGNGLNPIIQPSDSYYAMSRIRLLLHVTTATTTTATSLPTHSSLHTERLIEVL